MQLSEQGPIKERMLPVYAGIFTVLCLWMYFLDHTGLTLLFCQFEAQPVELRGVFGYHRYPIMATLTQASLTSPLP